MHQRKNILHFFVWTTFLLFCYQVDAQDIHFSQFNSSPMNLNPALAGNFDGQYRLIGNHRRQWLAVSPDAIPYQTFGFSADANNVLKNDIGAGLSIYNDRDGWSKLNTFQANLTGSYRLKLNTDSTLFLAPGIQVGITQQNINYDELSFDNQYNGIYYDENAGFGENFNQNNHLYANVNAGIALFYQIDDRTAIDAGISAYNITKPKQSFLGNDAIRLDRRLNFHARATVSITDNLALIPSYLFMAQGKFREFDIGLSGKYILNKSALLYRAVYAGIWARTQDAGFISAGIDYNAWHVGVSYDINLSTLRNASNGRGGFELAVIYIIQPKPPKRLRYKMCPDYI